MIRHSADADWFHPVLARDPAEETPDALLDFVADPRLAIFRAENEMAMQRRERVAHAFVDNRHAGSWQTSPTTNSTHLLHRRASPLHPSIAERYPASSRGFQAPVQSTNRARRGATLALNYGSASVANVAPRRIPRHAFIRGLKAPATGSASLRDGSVPGFPEGDVRRIPFLGRVLAILHPLHDPRAFPRDHLFYDLVFRATRNFATCFMASENVVDEGSASTAILTRPRTPANKFWLFGFGRHLG